jgi:hypothetical protein
MLAGDIFVTAASSALSLFDELAQRTCVGQMRQIRLLADLKYSVSPTGFSLHHIWANEMTSRWTEEFVCTGFLHTTNNTNTRAPCGLSGGFLLVFDKLKFNLKIS